MPRAPELKTDILKVVVLVLENHQGDILLTQRAKGKHLGGYWEFPGGKIEPDESNATALSREIQEELNYQPLNAVPLITIDHSYPTRTVRIFVYHEIAYNPQVTPAEGQPLKWVKKTDLKSFQLPEANQAIIDILHT